MYKNKFYQIFWKQKFIFRKIYELEDQNSRNVVKTAIFTSSLRKFYEKSSSSSSSPEFFDYNFCPRPRPQKIWD